MHRLKLFQAVFISLLQQLPPHCAVCELFTGMYSPLAGEHLQGRDQVSSSLLYLSPQNHARHTVGTHSCFLNECMKGANAMSCGAEQTGLLIMCFALSVSIQLGWSSDAPCNMVLNGAALAHSLKHRLFFVLCLFLFLFAFAEEESHNKRAILFFLSALF